MSGHIIGSSSSFVAENVGREGQAKAKRKSRRDADRELKVLLTRGDKEGMRAVVKAREVAKAMSKKKKEDPSKDPGKGKNQKDVKGKAKARKPESDSDLEVEDPPDAQASTQKNAYNAQVIKQLGFDPTVKPGQKRIDDSAVRKKVRLSTNLAVRYLISSYTSLTRWQHFNLLVKTSHSNWARGRDSGSVLGLLRLRMPHRHPRLLEASSQKISVTQMMRKLLPLGRLLCSNQKSQ